MDSAAAPRLIFNSKAGNASLWRLPLFIGISILGHVVMFYLFKVVTPSATRTQPLEQTVTMIEGNDPASAALLAALEDRCPAGMLINNGGRPTTPLPKLPIKSYQPSYRSYQPDFKFDWDVKPADIPLLADAERPMLPPLETNPPAPKPAPVAIAMAAQPRLVLQPNLEARGITSGPRWPADLSPPEEDSERYFFTVAVNANGSVRYCLSEGMTPPNGMVQAISRIRFGPRLGAELEWGEIEVHW
jgi:hypothetical protein